MRVLFRVAAGPKIGFGHLIRCRSLGRALGTTSLVSVRGSQATRSAAAARGLDVRPGGLALLRGKHRPHVVVVDDPSPAAAAEWVSAARQLRIPTVTLHDLGLGQVDSELSIDGSIEPGVRRGPHGLTGPMYAVLDPAVAIARERAPTHRKGVLVALGGGEHVHRWGGTLGAAILERHPDVTVRIVEGFARKSSKARDTRIVWTSAPDGLTDHLRQAAVAVVAGGVTLYEGAALGTPMVGLAVVAAQQMTIRGFARRGAAIDAGFVGDPAAIVRVADAVANLLSHHSRAARLGGAAARLVDGRGVFRAADAIKQLAARSEDHVDAA
jgi:UDP-2,4-diacetamido-2,4,6-trideoxy-beta-L-altropyranose hydrolase